MTDLPAFLDVASLCGCADLIPSTVGLRIFQAMPAKVQMKAIAGALTGKGTPPPQHTHTCCGSYILFICPRSNVIPHS